MTDLREWIGDAGAGGIRQGVRAAGRRVARANAPWLECPMGPRGRIGAEFYDYLVAGTGLEIRREPTAGLLPDFGALGGSGFDPETVNPRVRDFYEHTGCYRLTAWSEAAISTRIFLWALTQFVSRRMDQLNFPVSSLELAGGMTSEILPVVDADGARIYTGWLRRLVESRRVIYTGLYSVQQPPGHPGPCVKVSFPVPLGSSTVFLWPEALPDGSFKLTSSGARFGDPGFYRMVEAGPDHWHVMYLRTLREYFHVYIDERGALRTEHIVKFLGLTPLRLLYTMDRLD
jgi:hypothetical protein